MGKIRCLESPTFEALFHSESTALEANVEHAEQARNSLIPWIIGGDQQTTSWMPAIQYLMSTAPAAWCYTATPGMANMQMQHCLPIPHPSLDCHWSLQCALNPAHSNCIRIGVGVKIWILWSFEIIMTVLYCKTWKFFREFENLLWHNVILDSHSFVELIFKKIIPVMYSNSLFVQLQILQYCSIVQYVLVSFGFSFELANYLVQYGDSTVLYCTAWPTEFYTALLLLEQGVRENNKICSSTTGLNPQEHDRI